MSIRGIPLSSLIDERQNVEVHPSLVGTGNLDKAAIISAAGDSKWAGSPGFNVCLESCDRLYFAQKT